jgi:hypothetical protein
MRLSGRERAAAIRPQPTVCIQAARARAGSTPIPDFTDLVTVSPPARQMLITEPLIHPWPCAFQSP